MGTVVDAINSRPRAERAALVVPYQWTADEKTDFVTRFNSRVHDAWSARHPFHATKAYWEDLGAETDVEATLHAGAKGEQEHVSLSSYKVPDDYVGGIGVVNSGAGGATDNRMTLNSNDVTTRNDNLLRWSSSFPAGSATLDAAGKAEVRAIGGTFREGEKHCATCGAVVGVLDGSSNTMKVRVQGEGADPEANARERYAAVQTELVAGGLTGDNRTTFEYGGVGHRVSFAVGDGLAQVVAAHEAGHMFGLGDEYAVQAGSNISGTGAGAGTAAAHDQLAKDMGLKGSVHENNDGIMSLGAVVRPQHYSSFFWALKDVTGMDEWALGPTQAVSAPGEEPAVGDFPTPDHETSVA
jgi:hypothetical protein